ncbi:uncharacterized protein LOC100572663 [Acyrthosiphon pisum]|uniref:DRBM domain-containing protein n=1 Tax=Acyrthosiphon pisum TaxID=7029 RepID=A0A8R2D5V7_ACYPI|nr:uncharacterized protein LOC100572663 [Acyrthosiphon pisum]|eukprot:XP_016662860.1 PREDICTED: uncharacterized protein LOC100572663 [Acyrthosiphon pisum]
MNKTIKIDPQDAYSSSSDKSPITILNEYAAQNHLVVPHYSLIHDGSSLSIVSFKYSVNLDKFVAEGKGSSKKEAKQLAASNLLKKIINDKPQLLNSDFKECAISSYGNNIKLNTFFTKKNKTIKVDQQDMSAYSILSNKHPVAIVNEYATKNHFVPHYNLIYDGSSLNIASFKYSVNLDKIVAEGEGFSKREAKLWAATNLLKKIFNDKPQLLNTDFNECAISPYDKNIKLNAFFTKMNKANEVDQQDTHVDSSLSNKQPVTILNEYATKNHLVPHYNLIYDGSSLNIASFKYSVNLDKFVAEGEATSKKEAKHLAASNLLKKIINDKPQLLNTDFKKCAISSYGNNIKVNYIGQLENIVVEKCQNISGSIQALEKLNTFKTWPIKKSITKHPTCEDYHVVLKKTEWKQSDTLNMIVNQYTKNDELDLPEPFNILKKIIAEHKNMHFNSRIEKLKLDSNNYYYSCTFVLTDVYPNVYGWGVDTNSEMAQHIAVKQLLINICILLK